MDRSRRGGMNGENIAPKKSQEKFITAISVHKSRKKFPNFFLNMPTTVVKKAKYAKICILSF